MTTNKAQLHSMLANRVRRASAASDQEGFDGTVDSILEDFFIIHKGDLPEVEVEVGPGEPYEVVTSGKTTYNTYEWTDEKVLEVIAVSEHRKNSEFSEQDRLTTLYDALLAADESLTGVQVDVIARYLDANGWSNGQSPKVRRTLRERMDGEV